jgi:MFS family permease
MAFQFLERDRSIAKAGYNRWLIPPAALAIHLCIGQIYAYSVFNKPMTKILGVDHSAAGDWELTTLGWIFSIALVTLGASAAIFGQWLERVGPRKAMFVAALCFASGFMVASLGIHLHNIWLVYLGHGVLGGIGLGIGYISPVSTLMKWFPDRPGMATGMAIMGFGGGAMIASPLAVSLMNFYASSSSTGVGETFLTMGIIYFIFMMFGVFTIRIPPMPSKSNEGQEKGVRIIPEDYVKANDAIKTPQFYLLFAVLALNVTAGIGVLGQASVMIQEMFSAQSVSENLVVGAAAAGGFVGLLSIFNMLGRFFWSSMSDKLGRKNTYTIFFVLGALLYITVPYAGRTGNVVLFITCFALIISMYGGGFATIPAYLKDKFGTANVGAIHGRLLLAWSLAAILGPVTINYMRAYQVNNLGMAAADAYSTTMYIMAGLLLLGLISNLLVKPVDKKHFSPYHEN